MKIILSGSLLIALTAFVWSNDLPVPDNIPAPNGAYTLKIGKDVRIIDSGNATVLVIDKDVQGDPHVNAKWSADSRRVVVVANSWRGSGVEAAYFDGNQWHRTLQLDADLPEAELARQGGASGELRIEHRKLGDWLDTGRIAVSGELIFSGGKHVTYDYTLMFTNEPTHLDRGGYEEGAIRGVNYHVR